MAASSVALDDDDDDDDDDITTAAVAACTDASSTGVGSIVVMFLSTLILVSVLVVLVLVASALITWSAVELPSALLSAVTATAETVSLSANVSSKILATVCSDCDGCGSIVVLFLFVEGAGGGSTGSTPSSIGGGDGGSGGGPSRTPSFSPNRQGLELQESSFFIMSSPLLLSKDPC